MIEDDEKPEVAESVPEAKPRFTPLVIVSALLGFLLCLGSVGAYVSYAKSRGLSAEIVAAREEIKKKNAALADMQTQVEALSRQIGSLKEYSVARSRGNGGSKAALDVAPPAVQSEVPASAPAKPEKLKDPVPEKPVRSARAGESPAPVLEKKPKPEAQDCDLVGKSPEAQAETLKRCVSVMDGIAETPRAGAGGGRKR